MNDQDAQDSDSLKRQLQERRESLRLIDERIAEFVLPIDVPLQLKKEKQKLEQEIARLEAQLARAKPFVTEPVDRKDDARAENKAIKRQVPLFVLFLAGFLLAGIVVALFNQPFRCLLEYRVSEATVALIVLLVGISAAALAQIFPPTERKVLQVLIGGVALALLVSVLVFLPLGPPAEEDCFATKTPTLTPVPPTATPSKTPTPTDTPISTSTPTFTPSKAPMPTDTLIPTPTPSPTLPPGATRVWEKDSSVMVYVPAGEFWMDSTDADKVYLAAFWIDRTEVTNSQYRRCVEAPEKECAPPSQTGSHTRPSYYDDSDFDDYPVIYTSWHQANAYCRWAGKRLPTEAEWEKAARGTDGRIYPWGDDDDAECNRANHDNCVGDTTAVGSYPAGQSLYGALDLAGNVWEWTNSLYKPYPYKGEDGREDPSAPGERVVRGGSWGHKLADARVTYRWKEEAYSNWETQGFRCALPAAEP